jgi:hypothetical protein
VSRVECEVESNRVHSYGVEMGYNSTCKINIKV